MPKKRSLLISVSRWAPYPLILVPAALAFLYVYAFGVNVVAGDSWSIARLFGELHSGTLGVGDLWAQHGDHRMFFPRLAMLGLGLLTQYNSVAEMYLIQGCFLVTLVALFFVFRDSVGSRLPLVVPIAFLPIAFLVFSLRQYDNMLTGFQMTFAFVQVFSVLAFCFLYVSAGRKRFRRVAFSAALGSGTVAAFSAAQGLFAWPVGLLQLLVGPMGARAKRAMVGVWGAFGVAEWAVYFVGFGRSKRPSPLDYVFYNPVEGVEYFLTLLGASLFWQQTSAFIGGLLLVCLAAGGLFVVYKDGKLGEYWFWVALLLFSFVVLASITVGRSGHGIEGALTSRYPTFSVLAVAGIYAIFVKLVLERKTYLTLGSLGLLSALILLSVPLYYSWGIEVGKRIEAERQRTAFILATYESQPDEVFQEVHRNPNRVGIIREQARTLDELDYNVFSESRPPALPPPLSELSSVPSTTLSEVESVSGIGVDQGDQPISISAEEPFIEVRGWAIDAEAEDVAGGVYVDVDGKLFPALYGMAKEGSDARALDDHYGNPFDRQAVFERAIPVSDIGTGAHELSIVVLSNDKERYYRSDQEVALEIR